MDDRWELAIEYQKDSVIDEERVRCLNTMTDRGWLPVTEPPTS